MTKDLPGLCRASSITSEGAAATREAVVWTLPCPPCEIPANGCFCDWCAGSLATSRVRRLPRTPVFCHGILPGGLHTVVSSGRSSVSSPEGLLPVSRLALAVLIHGNQSKMMVMAILGTSVLAAATAAGLSLRQIRARSCHILCETALRCKLLCLLFL